MSKKSKAKKKEQRKLTFHQELKRTGCQSNQELKALKARREERTASKSRQTRHTRREIGVWLRAYEPMVYQLIGLGAQPQQEVEAGGFGESSEIDWASIESELIGTTTSGTTSQLDQVKEKEVVTPIGAAEMRFKSEHSTTMLRIVSISCNLFQASLNGNIKMRILVKCRKMIHEIQYTTSDLIVVGLGCS